MSWLLLLSLKVNQCLPSSTLPKTPFVNIELLIQHKTKRWYLPRQLRQYGQLTEVTRGSDMPFPPNPKAMQEQAGYIDFPTEYPRLLQSHRLGIKYIKFLILCRKMFSMTLSLRFWMQNVLCIVSAQLSHCERVTLSRSGFIQLTRTGSVHNKSLSDPLVI